MLKKSPLSVRRQLLDERNNQQRTLVILTLFVHLRLFTKIKTKRDFHSLSKVLKTMMVSTNQPRKNDLLN